MQTFTVKGCTGHGTHSWTERKWEEGEVRGAMICQRDQHSPLSWPMADWFMEECMMLSDWTLGGRGGIWLPTGWQKTRGIELGSLGI